MTWEVLYGSKSTSSSSSRLKTFSHRSARTQKRYRKYFKPILAFHLTSPSKVLHPWQNNRYFLVCHIQHDFLLFRLNKEWELWYFVCNAVIEIELFVSGTERLVDSYRGIKTHCTCLKTASFHLQVNKYMFFGWHWFTWMVLACTDTTYFSLQSSSSGFKTGIQPPQLADQTNLRVLAF